MNKFDNDKSINIIVPIIIIIVILSNFFNPVFLLILTNVILFILGWNYNEADKYGSSYYSVVVCKEYYRLLTSGFTHSNVAHIFCNMVSLYNLGVHVQNIIGNIPFLFLYFASMVLGCLLSIEYHHKQGKDYTFGVGASVAICGLIGFDIACVILLNLGSTFTITYLLKSISPLILCALIPNVDWIGHFCGLIVGTIVSLIILFLIFFTNSLPITTYKNYIYLIKSIRQELCYKL